LFRRGKRRDRAAHIDVDDATPHSCRTHARPARFAAEWRHAAQLPSVGCPANGISRPGVKMRSL